MEASLMSDNVDELFAAYPRHLTVPELAELLGIHRQTAYRWLQDGKIPGYYRNDTWVILRDDVRDWLKEGRVTPPTEPDEPDEEPG